MRHNHTTQIIPEKILDALKSYLLAISSSNQCKPHTIEVYKHCIDKFVYFLHTNDIHLMQEITTDDFRLFFSELQNDHNEGGVHHYFRAIKAFIRWYWDEYELETRNPIDKVKVKPPRVKPRPGIPIEHLEKMIGACKTENRLRDKTMLLCLLDSAARATEFCDLRLSDVDLATGRVFIKAGKGDKSRHVRFGDRALRSLRKYLKTREYLNENSALFVTDEGDKFNRFSLRLLTYRRADNAGVPHPGLHDFRRRCAYEMLKKGVSTKMISEYLGHSSVVVTERYLEVKDDDLMEAHRLASPSDFLKI